VFGEDSKSKRIKIFKSSKFRSLKSWRLAHLIVKSGDDLR